MHSSVRDLYKRFLIAGRNYPQGLSYIRQRAKDGFRKNSGLQDEVAVKKAVAEGRYWVREVVAISKLHKYRSIRRKYDWNSHSWTTLTVYWCESIPTAVVSCCTVMITIGLIWWQLTVLWLCPEIHEGLSYSSYSNSHSCSYSNTYRYSYSNNDNHFCSCGLSLVLTFSVTSCEDVLVTNAEDFDVDVAC